MIVDIPTTMGNAGRALLTESEREILAGERDVSKEYRWKVESVVRKRIEEEFGDDLDILAENLPDAFDTLEEEVNDRAGD